MYCGKCFLIQIDVIEYLEKVKLRQRFTNNDSQTRDLPRICFARACGDTIDCGGNLTRNIQFG